MGPADYISDDEDAPLTRKNPHARMAVIDRMADNWEANRRRASSVL
jgi:hypothetical protein